MSVGIVGRKIGMSRVFTEEGDSVSVTVVQVEPNYITQIKTVDTDQYSAIQVTTGSRKASRVNKALSGHFSKAGVEAGENIWEFRVAETEEYEVGKAIDVSVLDTEKKANVTGITKGFGFQGGIKRHNFRALDNSHGNSISHRSNGSIGQCQTPGRVFKGKKMSGHMGNVQRTARNIDVVRIDAEKGLVFLKGAVPGAKGGNVIIRQA